MSRFYDKMSNSSANGVGYGTDPKRSNVFEKEYFFDDDRKTANTERRTSNTERQTANTERQMSNTQRQTSNYDRQQTSTYERQPTSTYERHPTSTYERQTSNTERQTSNYDRQQTSNYDRQASNFDSQSTSAYERHQTSSYDKQPTSTYERQTSNYDRPQTSKYDSQTSKYDAQASKYDSQTSKDERQPNYEKHQMSSGVNKHQTSAKKNYFDDETEKSSAYDSSTHDSRSRKNRMERFEESLGKLNPPRWMKTTPDVQPTSTTSTSTTSSWRTSSSENRHSNSDKQPTSTFASATTRTSASSTTTPTNTSITTPTNTSTTPTNATTPRYSYAEYRRSYSAQRNVTPTTSYWKSTELTSSRPLSREPSPVPTWSRPATAQGGSRFSRWSASTLSDSAYSGQNTPTDSVVSGRSILDVGGGIGGISGGYSRPAQKPYLGWRSQENVATSSDVRGGRNTPNERLASSLRRSQQSGLDRTTTQFGSLNSSLTGSSQWRGSGRYLRDGTPGPADWFIHDSIRSVSSAIAEFCKADDVPAAPISAEDKIRRRRGRTRVRGESDYQPKSRIVWLESSFVSSTTNVNKNSNSTQL